MNTFVGLVEDQYSWFASRLLLRSNNTSKILLMQIKFRNPTLIDTENSAHSNWRKNSTENNQLNSEYDLYFLTGWKQIQQPICPKRQAYEANCISSPTLYWETLSLWLSWNLTYEPREQYCRFCSTTYSKRPIVLQLRSKRLRKVKTPKDMASYVDKIRTCWKLFVKLNAKSGTMYIYFFGQKHKH